MSQEQVAGRDTAQKPFGQQSDTTFWISLVVGLALIGALAIVQWASKASAANTDAKSTVSLQDKQSSVDPVYRCANGKVSFTPCS